MWSLGRCDPELLAFTAISLVGAVPQTMIRMTCQQSIQSDHDEDRLAVDTLDDLIVLPGIFRLIAGRCDKRSDPFANTQIIAGGGGSHTLCKLA